MKLHFVCRGNIYRSRLAEAYAKYLTAPRDDVQVSSSGIEASTYPMSGVNPVVFEYLTVDNLEEYLSPTQRQTSQDMLDDSDLIVFMNDSVYEDADKLFELPKDRVQVWHIPDQPGVYPDIKQQVENLLEAAL